MAALKQATGPPVLPIVEGPRGRYAIDGNMTLSHDVSKTVICHHFCF